MNKIKSDNKKVLAFVSKIEKIDKLNWNIGKLTAFLMGDKETIAKIEKAQAEKDNEKN